MIAEKNAISILLNLESLVNVYRYVLYHYSSWHTQPDFGQLYKVKCENMKNLDCPSFPMVCRAMFWWSGPPGAKKNFNPRIKGGPH